MSLIESKTIKECLDEKKYETIEMKKSKADKVKEDKQRLKDKIKRYEVLHPPFSNSKWSRRRRTTRRK